MSSCTRIISLIAVVCPYLLAGAALGEHASAIGWSGQGGTWSKAEEIPSESLSYLKDIPLRRAGTVKVSLGGSLRARYEYFRHLNWQSGQDDRDGYFLQRILLHQDLRWEGVGRVFYQLQSSIEEGGDGGPRENDENHLDTHQVFADIRLGEGLRVRGGRQEMSYGASRWIGVRDKRNVRLSFDGVRLSYRPGDLQLDAFLTRPVEVRRGIFDDGGLPQDFWGTYLVVGAHEKTGPKLDLYYFGLNDSEAADANPERGFEHRHSAGWRVSGTTPSFTGDVEAIYQWGSVGDSNVQAWGLAADSSYTFSGTFLSPEVRFGAYALSGGREGGTIRTFNPLFFRSAIFGEVALIGGSNIIALHPALSLQLSDTLSLMGEAHVFWRYSGRDAVYAPGTRTAVPSNGDESLFLGTQPSLRIKWQATQHLAFSLIYTHFFTGTFLNDSGRGDDVDYVTVWGDFRF